MNAFHPFCDVCNIFPAIVRAEGVFLCEAHFEQYILAEPSIEAIIKIEGERKKKVRCKICENIMSSQHKCKDKSMDCKKLIASLPSKEA